MDVKLVPVGSLHEDPNNARKHGARNLEAIDGSLKDFGQVEPLVVQKGTGKVIGGNGRLAVMRETGASEVYVVEVELDNDRATKLGIALNRTAELAEWDLSILDSLVKEMEPGALDHIGFDSLELERTLVDVRSHQRDTTPPPPEAPPKDPITKLGDLWTLGRHRLVCGDSTNAETVARVLDGATPNLMVTDPPYGVSYDPKWREEYDQFQRHSVGEVPNDDRVDWKEAWVLFPGAVAYVWHAGVHAETVGRGLREDSFDIRAQIIWSKQHFVFGRGAYHWKHEPCWYAVRKGRAAEWVGDRKQTTVWDIPNANPMGGSEDDINSFHGTQKPFECMARPIRNHGGDVYDPFAGTGTTLVAAEQLGRACYSIELSPGYCDVIVARWEKFTGEKAKRSST